MSDQLLVVLRLCLLVLVYLVFLRVLRAVWVELRAEAPRAADDRVRVPAAPRGGPVPGGTTTPAPSPAPSGASGAVAGIQILAPAALAGTAYRLEGETTIGRAAGCGIPIDDAHISKLHARVFPTGDRWHVEDLGSTNGTMVNGSVIVAAAPVGPGDRIQVGDVVMELV